MRCGREDCSSGITLGTETMNEQTWTLTCRISGNFFLVKREHISSSSLPFPAIRKLIIDPEFDEHNRQTGMFKLEMQYNVDARDGDPAHNIVADAGRDMLSYFLDLLAFLSGHRVTVIGKPTITHKRPGTDRIRALCFADQTTISPPVQLTYTSLLSVKIDQRLRRTLAWVRKGLQEDDVVDSFISLCAALELLSNQFEFKGSSVRKCPKCGYGAEMDASMKQKVKHFLVTKAGCSDEDFKSIWEMRNRVFHGSFSRSAESERELQGVRARLLLSIVKGTKMLLKIDDSAPPFEESLCWPFTDPILDLEFEKRQPPST